MINYTDIANTLNRLEREFTSCSDIQMPVLYSKLAVLELCGWIELSVDTILYEYVDNKILDSDCKKGIKTIIKKNHGFHYDNNLFPLFCSVLGINNFENVIDALPSVNFQNLKAITDAYTIERNKAAHTDTPLGTTRTYKAPSQVLTDFNLIKPAIQIIETEIQQL